MTQQDSNGEDRPAGSGFLAWFAPSLGIQMLPVTITLAATLVVSIVALVMAAGGQEFQPVQGTQGSAGSQGAQGEAGARGEPGAQGIQGVQGLQGPAGERGEPGAPGTQGPRGLPGEKGEPGSQGSEGVQGRPGEKGESGAQGVQGEPGEKGEPGSSEWVIVREKSQINNLQTKRVIVECPVSTVLLGGGAFTFGVERPPLTLNEPESTYPRTPKAWVAVAEAADVSGDWWLSAYVICSVP